MIIMIGKEILNFNATAAAATPSNLWSTCTFDSNVKVWTETKALRSTTGMSKFIL